MKTSFDQCAHPDSPIVAMWPTLIDQTKWTGRGTMANPEHLEILKQGVEVWNAWREKEPSLIPDLTGAALRGANLEDADLKAADLGGADLSGANLNLVDFTKADLRGVILDDAQLDSAHLDWADLREASLKRANLFGAHLPHADLRRANLRFTNLIDADLTDADLTGCLVFGTSAWKLKLGGTKQRDLVITEFKDTSVVTVDDIEVAQFVYLLLNNEKIRDVLDTVTSKVVLILGRFTPERKAVLDVLREELRLRGYVPILFDFEPSARRDITETVTLLARMARFIIADLTNPSSIPKELEAIVPHLAVPVQPLLEGDRPYAMFKDYWKYDWVLPVHRYDGLNSLLATLADKVIVPAETMTNALAEKRRRFEAELVRPR
jgi:Pentapeptide repeats (8 copies)